MTNMIQFIAANQETALIITVLLFLALTIWSIYLTLNLRTLKQKNRSLFEGSKARDLEEIIYEQIKNTKETSKALKELEIKNRDTRNLSLSSIHKVGVVRFNPFSEVGGNQSFAIALLDDSGSGVTISSLFGREGTRIYAKAIKNKESEYKLSDEEKEAIEKAMSS